MAKYRNIAVKFWSDQFVTDELTPEKRYFFLYLLTNEHTTQCGIYEITIRQIAFDTGYNNETVEKLLEFFSQKGKIMWSKSTNEIAIKNFIKYNPQASPKVKVFVEKELLQVKNKDLIEYLYSEEYPIDTLSQEEQEEELKEEGEREEKKEDLAHRKKVFGEKLIPFVDTYSKDMVREFFDYWTEANEGGKKMRFETEKIFNIAKRISTWSKNEKKFYPKKSHGQSDQKPVMIQSPLQKRNIHA